MKTTEELDITPLPWRVITVNGKIEAVESCLGIESPTVCNANRMKKADARLIAAAPELYEALAAMLSCAKKEAPFTMESGMSIAMDMARKAIEKAGGVE